MRVILNSDKYEKILQVEGNESIIEDGEYVDCESNSITSQKQMLLMQFAEYHGIEIAETYVDKAITGTQMAKREGFHKKISDLPEIHYHVGAGKREKFTRI